MELKHLSKLSERKKQHILGGAHVVFFSGKQLIVNDWITPAIYSKLSPSARRCGRLINSEIDQYKEKDLIIVQHEILFGKILDSKKRPMKKTRYTFLECLVLSPWVEDWLEKFPEDKDIVRENLKKNNLI